jgi:hypothetical protein
LLPVNAWLILFLEDSLAFAVEPENEGT